MKKVLIVYATGGMGHVSAAKALEEAFRNKYPDVEIKNVDIIDFADFLYKKFFVEGYNYVSSKQPKLWGWLYRRYNKQDRQWLPSKISQLCIEKRFIKFIKEFKPDFIISTHPLPMLLVSHSKEKDVIEVLSSMVVTDFGCHSFWVDPEVNYYFGATEDVGKCLTNYGAKVDHCIATGIPIQLKFTQPVDKAKLIKEIGLDENKKTVLIVGGQFTFEALKKVVDGVLKVNGDKVQFLIVAGRDKVLEQSLNNSSLDKNDNMKIFGFVDNMHELMTISDLIFTKAGGLTVSECMAKGLPMVINKVIPGQEEDNVNYLVAKGAAIKADDFDDIIKSVNDLLSNPEKLDKMKASAKAIGKPNSATDLADFVVSKISS